MFLLITAQDCRQNKFLTCTILSHMSFAVTQLPSDSPKDGKTVTLTFCVSHAAMAKVTGGFPFAVLKQLHKSFEFFLGLIIHPKQQARNKSQQLSWTSNRIEQLNPTICQKTLSWSFYSTDTCTT